jgi:hypothetical protein
MSEMSANIELLADAVCEMQKAELFALKDSANPFFKSRYADLSSCWAAARGPLTANGLGVIQTTEIGEAGVPVIVTTLVHKSGQWIRGRLSMAPAKADPQGVGSAITYGRRYGLCAMLGIVSDADDDGEGAKPTVASILAEMKRSETVAELTRAVGKGKTISISATDKEKLNATYMACKDKLNGGAA